MSVQSKVEGDKLVLTLDNGDYAEFKKVMDKWDFKDHQSLMRFALTLLTLNENNYFPIKLDNQPRDITPAPHLLKAKNNEE